ncbi:MAG: 16S rRNA (guanine(527)-N(7))-methyltransferase RsmG [Bacteroidota bacterium]
MHLIRKYFPDLDQEQFRRFEKLLKIIPPLNEKVNIISRKDVISLEERHILHSLAIAKKFSFGQNSSVIDVGTGGGFPGIPLAILFPETRFTLVDSIGKKIRLVQEISEILKLQNVRAIQERMENLKITADFVVSRAVTAFPQLYRWSDKLIKPGLHKSMPNGLISLKGGDLEKELEPFKNRIELFPISTWFEEPFFCSKMIVYLKK